MKSKNDEREEKNIKNVVKQENKNQKETKSAKEGKNQKETKSAKESKIQKETKNVKESKNKQDESEIEKQVEKSTEKKTKNINKKNVGEKINTPFRIIWSILSKILTILILFISIIIVVQKVTNNEEAFLGFRMFRVQTGSMIPKYQIGDVILVKEVDPDSIQIGNDVTYEGKTGAMKGLIVTHRVIDIEEVDGKRIFHTKGIANNLEDPVISEDQINGVVQTKMYIISLICMLFNNKYVFYFCGILPLTIYVAFRIFRGKKVKKIEREN